MSGWEAMAQGAPDPFFAEGRDMTCHLCSDGTWKDGRKAECPACPKPTRKAKRLRES
jgi:hypothetical protein